MAGVTVRLRTAGQEMQRHPPRILARTAGRFGAARAMRQRRAILNKARRARSRR